MIEQVLEVRVGNGPEATRQASEEVHTIIKDQGKLRITKLGQSVRSRI